MSFDGKRNIVFRDPEGACIHETPLPGPVCGDAVQRLREDHRSAGLEIGEDTAPLWDGDRLDLHLAVLMLRPMGDT